MGGVHLQGRVLGAAGLFVSMRRRFVLLIPAKGQAACRGPVRCCLFLLLFRPGPGAGWGCRVGAVLSLSRRVLGPGLGELGLAA